jgi:hypothetical protein
MPANDPIIDGDTHFVGVNMRLDPGQLKPGFCASAKNKRFVNGKAATRPGIKKMPWSNKAADAWLEKDDAGVAKTYPAGNIVTYSGLASVVSGTEDQVKGGTGTISLQYAAPPDLNDGNFNDSSSSAWNFTEGWSRTLIEVDVNGTFSIGVFTSSGMTVTALEATIPSATAITFSNGAVFTTSAIALSGATTLYGTLTVDDLIGVYTGNYGSYSAERTSSVTAAENIYQDVGALLGCSYIVTYEVSNWAGGNIQALISGSSRGALNVHPGVANSYATFTDTIVSRGLNPDRLYIQSLSGFRGRVDNVTITAISLPGKVDVLGAYDQGGVGGWRATGPSSNNSKDAADSTKIAGPFFKSLTTNSGEPPMQAYVPVIGSALPSAATSTLDATPDWENLGHRTYGYGTVYGAGIFRDPLSVEHVLVVASDGVYATKEGNPSVRLTGHSSFSADVELVQCFNVVVMFRGSNLEPLVMKRLDVGFVSISKEVSDTDIDENDSDGTEPIPNAATGLFFSNRLLIPYNKDMVAASDFLNYTAYAPIMSNFRINQGSEDELVSLVRINNSTIACFKTNSIYMVSNIYGNLTDITLDEVTREYGAVGKNSIVQVGNDVVFLSSKKGVTSLGVAANGKVSAVDVPLSEPIQPLIAIIACTWPCR